MPASTRLSAVWLAVAVVVLLVAAVVLAAEPPDVPKASPIPAPKEKEQPKAGPPGPKLPDGTYLWTGSGTDGERVLTAQKYQRLIDQIEQLKKQLAARKGMPPSGCAVEAHVKKRGDTAVATLKATYTFRTAAPGMAVSLGGKRAFLVAATLDGAKLPILDTGEDGFAALVETAGDHKIVLDLESPVGGRGMKTEIGFELGLPRAAITTLVLDPPAGVTRVSLVTRTPDPLQAKPPEVRRVPGLDVKALAPPPPGRDPYPLGPVDSVEVAWEPPAAVPVVEAVQSAEVTVTALLAEGFIETTAKFAPHGPARTWRFAAPADAVVTVDRAATATPATEPGTSETPVVTKPGDPAKPVWAVAIPAGTSAADWVVTAVVRVQRPKTGDPKHAGPFALGPFAVLDVSRQTGTVRVAAAANTRLVVKHGPDLRQDVLPAPVSDEESVALFRLTTGPTGSAPPPLSLLAVEAHPLTGKVAVRPAYKLTHTEGGWAVRADVRVTPIHTTIGTVMLELPAGWRGLEVSPPDVVDSVKQVRADGPRQVFAVQLTAEHKQPFDLVMTATIPAPPLAHDAAVLLPRFPGATERDTTATASVSDGLEVRGTGHGWDGNQPAAWGTPLAPAAGADGKTPKAVTAVAGKFEHGLGRLDLTWSPYRPPLAADVRAEVEVHDGQVLVRQRVRLRSPDGFPKAARFRGAADLKALSPFDLIGPGEWAFAPAADAKEATLSFEFAVPLPQRPADGGPRLVPISLVLPAGASRTETVVRVWAMSGAGRTIAVDPGAWRESPPEPTPERDALPALTLAGAGADLPLVLQIRDATETGAATVWVERGLVQAWAGDDGTTYRARFLLRRWLSDAVEVRLPEALGDTAPEVFLDDPPRRVNAAPVSSGPGRAIRVPLPEAKPGRVVVLELRYKLPAPADEEAVYVAPRPGAAFAGPVRWQIAGPAGSVALLTGEGRAEQRWRPRFGMMVPVSASADDLERWFASGVGGDDGAGPAEATVIRTTGPDAVRAMHVSRLTLVVACSVGLLLVGLVVSRLPGGIGGPVVALLAGAAAVAAVLYPQPAAQAAGAAGPGVATLVLVLTVQGTARWYYHRRVTYLPGFARGRPEPVAGPLSAGGSAPSGRGRLSPNGSTGPADAGVPAPSGSRS